MATITNSKNIAYGSITAGGNVHIGDTYYSIERDFQSSVLFLQLAKQHDEYKAMLSIKAKEGKPAPLLVEALTLNIPQSLFDSINQFQEIRRGQDAPLRDIRLEFGNYDISENAISQRIFEAFFSGEIGKVCQDFMELLQNRKINQLLLVIATADEYLLSIPWEMVLPKLKGENNKADLPIDSFGLIRTRELSNEPLSTAGNKTIDNFNIQGPTKIVAPLKLLFIPALPESLSEEAKFLEIEKEQKNIIEAVRDLEASGDREPRLVMEIMDSANLEEITKALRSRSHDIVHISGHGSFQRSSKKGVLYMENEDGDEALVSGEELAKELSAFACIKLLVISACETATGSTEGNIADQLAASGIPAVLAMRFAVTDEAARRFAQSLYTGLANADTLTKAIHDARKDLFDWTTNLQKQQPNYKFPSEWFTPVLYQNQVIGPLIEREGYDIYVRKRFYPEASYLATKSTRLIGEGFIGRKRLIIRLRKTFDKGKAISLFGLGGLGKTTTAEAFTENYKRRYNSKFGILMFRKDTEIQPTVILNRIFKEWKNKSNSPLANQLEEVLDRPDLTTTNKLQILFDNCLRDNPIIFIFDNAEDIQIDENNIHQQAIASPELRDFLIYFLKNLPATCRVIFTTRYKLIDFEDSLVNHIEISKLTYAEQYRYINASETLRTLPREAREIVYKRMDGHPRGFEFLESLVRIDQSFDLVSFDSSIGKVEEKLYENLLLERIWKVLTDNERLVLQAISIFSGPCPFLVVATLLNKSPLLLSDIEDRTNKDNILTIIRNSELNLQDLHTTILKLHDWSLCFYNGKDHDIDIQAIDTDLVKILQDVMIVKNIEVHAISRKWLQKYKINSEQIRKWAFQAGFYYFRLDITLYSSAEFSFDKLETYLKSKDYFKKSENWDAYSMVSKDIVEIYRTKGMNFEAERQLNDAFDKDISLKSKARLINDMGLNKARISEYTEALDYFLKSLELYQQIGSERQIGIVLTNIGDTYIRLQDYDRAMHHLEKSLEIFKRIKQEDPLASTYYSIADVFSYKGEYQEAIKYSQKSLKICKQFKDNQSIARTLHQMGTIYLWQLNYKKALNFFKKSLEECKNTDNIFEQGNLYEWIGDVYEKLHNFDKALESYQNSLLMSKHIKYENKIPNLLSKILNIYSEKKDWNNTLKYLIQLFEIFLRINPTEVTEVEKTILSFAHLGYDIEQLKQIIQDIKNANSSR